MNTGKGVAWRRAAAAVGLLALLAAPLPLLAAPAEAATQLVLIDCASAPGSTSISASLGDSIYLSFSAGCGVDTSSATGSVTKDSGDIDQRTYTASGTGPGQIAIVLDYAGSPSYTVNVAVPTPSTPSTPSTPAYPANVGPDAIGPECPYGGHLNEQGDLCVGTDPAPTPTPTPSPSQTVNAIEPQSVTPGTASKTKPRAWQTLASKDIKFAAVPGSSEIWIRDKSGNPLQLLSMTDESGVLKMADDGINYSARPANWQRLGYGDLCWTYTGYSNATGMILPTPTPPFRTAPSEWTLSAAILGTSTGNVVFRDPNPGDTVDAAGRVIDTVTICAKAIDAAGRAEPAARPAKKGGSSGGWCHVPPGQGPNGPGRLVGGGGGHAGHPYDYPASAYGGSCTRGLPTFTRPVTGTATTGTSTTSTTNTPDPTVSYCRATGDANTPYVMAQAPLSTLPKNSNPWFYPTANWGDIVPSRIAGPAFAGVNYSGYGKKLLAGNCEVPVYSSTQPASVPTSYCLNGQDYDATHTVQATATSNVSQADADAKAKAAAQAQAAKDQADGNAIPAGATDGTCPRFTSTKTFDLEVPFCYGGRTQTPTFTGSGTGTSTRNQTAADNQAQAAAQKDANAQAAAFASQTGIRQGECTVYKSEQTVTRTFVFCNAGNIQSSPFQGSGNATSTISQADADAKALTQATNQANALAQQYAGASGATFGQCQVYSSTKSDGGTAYYCLNGSEGSYDYSATASATSTVSQDDADAKAKASATQQAEQARASRLPQGAAAGKCTGFAATATKGGTADYCLNGVSGSYGYSATASATSTLSQEDAQATAAASAAAKATQAQADLLPAGATAGQCVLYAATLKSGGTAPYCLNGSNGAYGYEASATATSTVSQADADAQAAAAASQQAQQTRTALLPAGATAGQCIVFNSTVKAGGTAQYCLAGKNGSYGYEASATATSTVSQADADAQATAAATQQAAKSKAALLPSGADPYQCPPPPPIIVRPNPPVTITGTGKLTIAVEPPKTLTGCGANSAPIYPYPPEVPVPLFNNCVPTPTGTATPTPNPTMTPTPTPTEIPTGVIPPVTVIPPTRAPGGTTPTITVPTPTATGIPPDAAVTLVLTNGPDVVTVNTTVDKLVNVSVPNESSTQTTAKPTKPTHPTPNSVPAGRSRGAVLPWQ